MGNYLAVVLQQIGIANNQQIYTAQNATQTWGSTLAFYFTGNISRRPILIVVTFFMGVPVIIVDRTGGLHQRQHRRQGGLRGPGVHCGDPHLPGHFGRLLWTAAPGLPPPRPPRRRRFRKHVCSGIGADLTKF